MLPGNLGRHWSAVWREKLELRKKCENFPLALDFFDCRVKIVNDSAAIKLRAHDSKRFDACGIEASFFKKFNDFNTKRLFLAGCGRRLISFICFFPWQMDALK